MGSSSWWYFTPYQPEVQLAFQDLQQRVFASGEFENTPLMLLEAFLRLSETEQVANLAGMRAFFTTYNISPNPSYETPAARIAELRLQVASIEGLFREDEGGGTHSILDMRQVANRWEPLERQRPDWIYPLPIEYVRELFHTDWPEHAEVEAKLSLVGGLPYNGRYFVIYEGEMPTEYCFVGISGD